MAEADVADTTLADAQEQADIGLAEAVDRLHRIANHEQRPAIVRHPAAGQFFNEADLARAGVLELVDQQVADAPVEAQAEFGRIGLVAQGGDGARREFAEIDLAGLADTAWPFIVALAGVTVALLGMRRSPELLVNGLFVWLGTLGFGMWIRANSGAGVQVSFVIVAGLFLLEGMLGWRVGDRDLHKRGRD